MTQAAKAAPGGAERPVYPVPDAVSLTAAVLAELATAADARTARALVVKHLHAAKAAANTAF